MEFDILSNIRPSRRIDRKKLLKRKYDIQEQRARAARMQATAATTVAETGARTAERQYGPGGLVGEELARRYPHGVPAKEAETARITARGYAGAALMGAGTAAGRLGLEREEFEFGKRYLGRHGEMPGGGLPGRDTVGEIRGIAEGGAARPGIGKCPEGYYWDGTECVPSM